MTSPTAAPVQKRARDCARSSRTGTVGGTASSQSLLRHLRNRKFDFIQFYYFLKCKFIAKLVKLMNELDQIQLIFFRLQ